MPRLDETRPFLPVQIALLQEGEPQTVVSQGVLRGFADGGLVPFRFARFPALSTGALSYEALAFPVSHDQAGTILVRELARVVAELKFR